MPSHLVAALAYDRICTFELGCTVEVFALARPELEVPWYQFAVCAEKPGQLAASGGISIGVRKSVKLLDRADTIVIPGWTHVDVAPSEALIRKLRRAHERGARLCSICSGVFVLAAAGLLEGKRATTHWRYAETLQKRYPLIQVDANALYIDEGNIITSAGSAAGIDMMLHLVRLDYGPSIANRVAQRLVLPPHRGGDQAQFIPQPMALDGRSRLAKLLDWIRRHLDAPHTIESLAQRASMSTRTLLREFKASTGRAPYNWLVYERIQRAKEMLESTDLSIEAVALRVGIGSPESLRHHFGRIVGTPPSVYRERFSQRDDEVGRAASLNSKRAPVAAAGQ